MVTGASRASLDSSPHHRLMGSSLNHGRTRADTVLSPLTSSQSGHLRTINIQYQTFGVQVQLPPVQMQTTAELMTRIATMQISRRSSRSRGRGDRHGERLGEANEKTLFFRKAQALRVFRAV